MISNCRLQQAEELSSLDEKDLRTSAVKTSEEVQPSDFTQVIKMQLQLVEKNNARTDSNSATKRSLTHLPLQQLTNQRQLRAN